MKRQVDDGNASKESRITLAVYAYEETISRRHSGWKQGWLENESFGGIGYQMRCLKEQYEHFRSLKQQSNIQLCVATFSSFVPRIQAAMSCLQLKDTDYLAEYGNLGLAMEHGKNVHILNLIKQFYDQNGVDKKVARIVLFDACEVSINKLNDLQNYVKSELSQDPNFSELAAIEIEVSGVKVDKPLINTNRFLDSKPRDVSEYQYRVSLSKMYRNVMLDRLSSHEVGQAQDDFVDSAGPAIPFQKKAKEQTDPELAQCLVGFHLHI